jgi:hypothetical protein
MKGLALDVLRTGKKYRIINHGEIHEFVIENIRTDGDFDVKDLHTLERYRLNDLTRYGKGEDFEIRELE